MPRRSTTSTVTDRRQRSLHDYFPVAPRTPPAAAAAAAATVVVLPPPPPAPPAPPPERPLPLPPPQRQLAVRNVIAAPPSQQKLRLQQLRAAERVALERLNTVLQQIDHNTPSLKVRGNTSTAQDVSKIAHMEYHVFFS